MMAPLTRGHIVVDIESAGPAKSNLDVLVWVPTLERTDSFVLDRIEVLRVLLRSLNPPKISINLLIPDTHQVTARLMIDSDIQVSVIPVRTATQNITESLGRDAPDELQFAVATALHHDADMLLTKEWDWFPYIEVCDTLGLFLTSTELLPRQCELFVRGHDVPWAFGEMVWNMPWSTFYMQCELDRFRLGMKFLDAGQGAGISQNASELGRMLVYNRLPNLCFTRDRLLFYDLQHAVVRRAKWRRQRFALEVGYYLNNYYFLIHGGFDHIASLVNNSLSLGVAEKEVGATYKRFLALLKAKASEIHKLFTDPKTTEFMQTIGALRHFAAHRGQVMPGPIYEEPEEEPSLEDIDQELSKTEAWSLLDYLPFGKIRDAAMALLRHKAKLSLYKVVAEDIVIFERDGKRFMVKPMNDIEVNFERFHTFMDDVLSALLARIQSGEE